MVNYVYINIALHMLKMNVRSVMFHRRLTNRNLSLHSLRACVDMSVKLVLLHKGHRK